MNCVPEVRVDRCDRLVDNASLSKNPSRQPAKLETSQRLELTTPWCNFEPCRWYPDCGSMFLWPLVSPGYYSEM